MKPRARRTTIGAAVLVAVLLAVLAVANWGTVRDHVEAWHFQLTRKTETEEPSDTALESLTTSETHSTSYAYPFLYGMLARYSERPVIFEAYEGIAEDIAVTIGRGTALVGADVVQLLKDQGYHVLEQRFPRRAYVVIRDARPMWIEYPGGSPHNGTERP